VHISLNISLFAQSLQNAPYSHIVDNIVDNRRRALIKLDWGAIEGPLFLTPRFAGVFTRSTLKLGLYSTSFARNFAYLLIIEDRRHLKLRALELDSVSTSC